MPFDRKKWDRSRYQTNESVRKQRQETATKYYNLNRDKVNEKRRIRYKYRTTEQISDRREYLKQLRVIQKAKRQLLLSNQFLAQPAQI